MGTDVIAPMVTGICAIIAAIIGFISSIKSANSTAKKAKEELQNKHFELSKEHQSIEHGVSNIEHSLSVKLSDSSNKITEEINSVEKKIDIEIAKAEERRKAAAPEKIDISHSLEQINEMYINWLETEKKVKGLESEVSALKAENKRLRERLYTYTDRRESGIEENSNGDNENELC